MQPWVIALAVAVPTVILLAVGIGWLLRSMATAARARLDQLCAGRTPTLLDQRALFFGLASGRAMQLRGNGLLALFDTELVFVQFVVDRVIRIPLDTISEVKDVGGFRGKTIARRLLQVTWRQATGHEAAAWYVEDLAAWQAALARARPATTGAVADRATAGPGA